MLTHSAALIAVNAPITRMVYLNRCTEDIKSLAYRSLVRPSLDHCAAVWDPHTNDLIYQLVAVQRILARFVKNNYDRQSSVTIMLEDLNWSTLAERRKIARLAVFHKAYEGHLSIPVRNLLHPVMRIGEHTTNYTLNCNQIRTPLNTPFYQELLQTGMLYHHQLST